MIKSKELSSKNSCINRAGDDEPLFVLRANDPDAPGIVDTWAKRYYDRRILNRKLAFKEKARRKRKYEEARELAQQMKDWRAAQ